MKLLAIPQPLEPQSACDLVQYQRKSHIGRQFGQVPEAGFCMRW